MQSHGTQITIAIIGLVGVQKGSSLPLTHRIEYSKEFL